MTPIRVHLGPMPEMLRAIIGDLLSSEPDIVVAGKSTRSEDCLREARRQRAGIIVAQDVPNAGTDCLDLILAEPPLGVLAVSADGQSAAGVSFARQPITLNTGSRSIFADTIRRMAAQLGAAAVIPCPDRVDPGRAGDEAMPHFAQLATTRTRGGPS